MKLPVTFRQIRIAVLLVLVAAAGWAYHHGPESRGYELLPDMAHSLAYDAYSTNPIFRDGKTLQPPVPGTIAVGAPLPFRYAATVQDAERAGRELRNPLPPSPAALARGRQVYTTFCSVCHGEKGRGDGPIIQTKKFPNPPSYMDARLLSMPDGQMFHVITRGTELMPSYAGQISPEDRWKAIHYIRQLQKTRTPLRLAELDPR
jgi:mono/diheme cytochrome c family protein